MLHVVHRYFDFVNNLPEYIENKLQNRIIVKFAYIPVLLAADLIYLDKKFYTHIRLDLGEVGWGDVDWIGLAKDRNRWRVVVNSVLNLRVP
jgi:hypothetical protein